MASENDSYDEFDDSLYDDEILSDKDNDEVQDVNNKQVKSNNMATWRKIEDFWDNYKLNKQLKDDLYDDNYGDLFPDGELN